MKNRKLVFSLLAGAMLAVLPVPKSVDKFDRATCRPGCGACCTAPSITSPIPGMPQGKPAGVPCVQLDADMRCRIFGRPERPAFCGGLKPSRRPKRRFSIRFCEGEPS